MRPNWARGKIPPGLAGQGGNFTALGTLLLVTALGIVKNSRFCMSLCYIPVGLFLKFEATLFSALHLVLCWSFGIIGINCNVRFYYIYDIFKCQH